MQRGIDVSHYQRNITWTQVKQSGISFAILKAMYETDHRPDEYFEKNYQGCKANGIELGVYDFIGSQNIKNPKKDAEDLLKILNGRELPWGIWLDAESASLRAIGKQKITELLEIEADIFRKAGYAVGIYCNADWYKNVLDSKYLASKYPFWIARYPKDDTGLIVERLNPQSYCQAWQYSSKGKVSGIGGNVDMDLAYITTKDMAKYKTATTLTLGEHKITANTLNIRSGASATSKDVGDLRNGSIVTIDKIENGFGHFEGWVSMKYLK